MKLLLALALISLSLLGTAGCSAAKITCTVSTGSWFRHGGLAGINAATRALHGETSAANAAAQAKLSPASLTALKTAGGKLADSVTALRGNLPPSCVPGVRADMRAGLEDFANAVTEQNRGIAAAGRHDVAAVRTRFRAAAADLRAGGAKFIAAAHALTRYVGH